jgi:hypothetical protein
MTAGLLPTTGAASRPVAPSSRPAGTTPRPARTGLPWTDEDYERLVGGCRRGTGLEPLAEELGRSWVAVLDRARRMLPVDERGLPRDRALPRLGELLEQDPAYDWAAALRTSPPPPPVERPVYLRRGLEGLYPEELLEIAEVFVLEHRGGHRVRDRLLTRVRAEGLWEDLEATVGRTLVQRALEPGGTDPAHDPWGSWGPASMDGVGWIDEPPWHDAPRLADEPSRHEEPPPTDDPGW